jgi:hypothetical protein
MTLTQIIEAVRETLLEDTPSLWSNDELVVIINRGVKDLWRAIKNQYQDYFLTISEVVALAANGTALTSVPTDCSVVRGLEQVDLATYPNLTFEFAPWNSDAFQSARAANAFDPYEGGKILWCVIGAGAPVAAPTIRVAPASSRALTIRLSYIPTVPTLVIGDTNPIPGEADQALIDWTIAHAKAKDTEGLTADPTWLALYKAEKENILVSLAPRQQDSETVVADFFAPYWGG